MKRERESNFRPRLQQGAGWEQLIELARKMGTREAVARLKEEYHRVNKVERADELQFDSYSTRIKSLDDLIEYHEIDTQKWEAESVVTNYYEQGAKLPTGEVVTTPLHQIKARFIRRKTDIAIEATISRIKDELLDAIEAAASKPPKVNSFQVLERKGLEVEAMITDLHLGKIGFDFEALDYNWSIQEATDAYHAVIDDLLDRLKGERIARFLLPTGNDLLNIDNANSTTTRATPQMSGEFWETLFIRGSRMVATTIERLAGSAPVKAIFIRGNHDSQSVFSMGEQMAAMYRHDPRIVVDNGLQKRKYHSMENVLIGYYHFDDVKPRNAHNSIIADVPHLAFKRHKAIHGGHYHKNLKRLMQPFDVKDEAFGVEIEVCPSLSPTDRWHYNNLFVGNIRRSKSFVWSPTDGLLDELYFNLNP